jgi:hypothetical protein
VKPLPDGCSECSFGIRVTNQGIVACACSSSDREFRIADEQARAIVVRLLERASAVRDLLWPKAGPRPVWSLHMLEEVAARIAFLSRPQAEGLDVDPKRARAYVEQAQYVLDSAESAIMASSDQHLCKAEGLVAAAKAVLSLAVDVFDEAAG